MNPPNSSNKVFSSWKEIASYLGKGVRTVQRWEKSMGLPISRPPGASSNVIVTTEAALREWIQDAKRGTQTSDGRQTDAEGRIAELQERLEKLESENLRLKECLAKLQQQFEELQSPVVAPTSAVISSKTKSEMDARRSSRTSD